jgi:hypothetical protein
MKKVKKYVQLFCAILLLWVGFSCEKEFFPRIGFDSTFSKNSKGLVLIHVDEKWDSIFLAGEIYVEEGEVGIDLINPGNETVYTCHFESKGNYQISNVFPAGKGVWKLKYISKNGVGTIDLHACF